MIRANHAAVLAFTGVAFARVAPYRGGKNDDILMHEVPKLNTQLPGDVMTDARRRALQRIKQRETQQDVIRESRKTEQPPTQLSPTELSKQPPSLPSQSLPPAQQLVMATPLGSRDDRADHAEAKRQSRQEMTGMTSNMPRNGTSVKLPLELSDRYQPLCSSVGLGGLPPSESRCL